MHFEAVGAQGVQLDAEVVQNGAAAVQGEAGAVITPHQSAEQTASPRGKASGEVDLDRAKRDAERIVEWEKKTKPTADEMNTARTYVKGFDNLDNRRRSAIIRMVRSGKNIDEGVIRGVSNIMAITNKKGAVLAPDVEIRFAEFGKDSTKRGIKTEVGGKTVILLNANATYKDTIRGTVAHEIVHYLENRKGYKELAEYAMKHAKADKVAQVKETYRKEYTNEERKANPNATEEEIAARVDEKMRDEAAVNSEIVGNVVAELLGSEKFLKRYAQMGEEQSSVVKRIARFVKGIANALKEKDKEAGAVARQMMDLFDRALGSEVSGEKTGEKADISSDYVDNTNYYKKYQMQIKKWDKKTTGFSFVLGNTSTALLKANIPQAQIRLDASKVKKAIDKHDGMTIEVFAKLTDIIENPIVVVDSNTVQGRKVIIGDVVDANGKTVVLALELSPSSHAGNVLTGIIKIATAQGRSHIQSLLTGNIQYIDPNKNRVQQWLNANRLQLPLRSSTVNSNNSIHQDGSVVNTSDEKNSDAAYMAAVERGDMATAQKMVDEAAKKAGYTDKLYHGTKQFGFTKFDPSFSDDKISIFVTDSNEIAQTYSGQYGTREIFKQFDVEKMSMDEMVNALNGLEHEVPTEYKIMSQDDVNALKTEVDAQLDKLSTIVKEKILVYSERMAKDFDELDADTHETLVRLRENLHDHQYEEVALSLFELINQTDAFAPDRKLEDLVFNASLLNKFENFDMKNGAVVVTYTDGYKDAYILKYDQVRNEFKSNLLSLSGAGNYSLYGMPQKQLVIHGNGQRWDNIRNWARSIYYTQEKTYVNKDNEYFKLFDKKTDKEIIHGRIAINQYSNSMSKEQLHLFMINKVNNGLDIRMEHHTTTRDIAKIAKEQGYESVKFENIVDNGGSGKNASSGNVYAYFTPELLKSADPVTYDDNGNVVPLSERFNEKKSDIRYDLGDAELEAEVDREFKEAVEGKVAEKKKKAAEKKQAAKSGTTAEGEGKAIRTGSAEAGRLATRLGHEFGFKKATVEKIRAKLEALEAVFIKGTREEYVEEYKKRVQEIFAIIAEEGEFELSSEQSYKEFQTYMRGKKFRFDKRFRQNMGKEEWKSVWSAIRGRLASDNNKSVPHVDAVYG